MPTAEAHITTDRPSRYLVQLCRHAGQMGSHRGGPPHAHRAAEAQATHVEAEWSQTDGVINFGWGRCTVQAAADALLVRVEAADEEKLRRIQELVTRNLTRFSTREPLTVSWQLTGQM
jgi:hypothetical protein